MIRLSYYFLTVGNYVVVGLLAHASTALNTSITWQIQNVQAKCDLVTLDSGLNESYIKLLKEARNSHNQESKLSTRAFLEKTIWYQHTG